jgi:adenine-specific DNA-methyltransferase
MEAIEDDELVFVEGAGGISVYYKQYLYDEDGNERGAKPYSVIEGIYTQQGTNELTQILGDDCPFKFPKPSALIRHLLEVFTTKGDLVLDSCAGSGTTGHATLSLSKESGKRSFVLIQQPFDSKDFETEKTNITRQVTQPRLQKVIGGYSYRKRKTKNGNRQVKVEPLGGSFSYLCLGEPLFGEYRNFGKKLPKWEELARYIFYTETSRECDAKKMNEKTGLIGTTEVGGGTSYYLLYTPNNQEDQHVSLLTLPNLVKKDKNRTLVIYAERIWLHADELRKFEKEHNRTIRTMLVPFGLK